MTTFDLFVGLSSAVLGLAAGAAYFAALRVNVELYVTPGGGKWRPVLLHAARLIAIAIVFSALATQGAWPLLAGLLGFLGARLVASKKRAAPS